MSTCTFRILVFRLLAAALCFVTPGSLWAAYITIDDTSPNETIDISAGSFNFFFELNGQPFTQGTTVTLPESGPVTFYGSWITALPLPAQIVETYYLVEQLSGPLEPTTEISDILQIQIDPDSHGANAATITGSFISADDLGYLPGTVNPANVFFEDGSPVNVSFDHIDIQITSDAVPEPSTFLLAAIGLLGLGAYGWRRRREA